MSVEMVRIKESDRPTFRRDGQDCVLCDLALRPNGDLVCYFTAEGANRSCVIAAGTATKLRREDDLVAAVVDNLKDREG